jgi:hypothetical protein
MLAHPWKSTDQAGSVSTIADQAEILCRPEIAAPLDDSGCSRHLHI